MKWYLPQDKLHSLRWRLIGAICAAVLLLSLLTGWFSYTKAQHEAEELMDGNLAQTARLLLAITHDNEKELPTLAPRLATVRGADNNVYEPPLEFQIGLGNGTILARSPDAPDFPILGIPGYSNIIRHSESWRVLNAVSLDGRYRVQVAEAIHLRDRAAFEVATQTIFPLFMVVPALILIIYFSITSTLNPLDRLAGEVAELNPDNLSPLTSKEVPTEARPLVNAINHLFQRVTRALENERRFTADAAHELRTPLAALKVQTQVALASGEAPTREHALKQIEVGVDRASRLVEQLLRLARLDPLSCPPHNDSIDFSQLVTETLGNMPPHKQEIVFHAPSRTTVRGDYDLLQIALRNLMDNALRYSPEHCCITIEVISHDSHCDFCIRDNGPGISQEVLARLGERFYRAQPGKSEGNGLGLVIVTRIAELHGAQLVMENLPTGGFAVCLKGLQQSPA